MAVPAVLRRLSVRVRNVVQRVRRAPGGQACDGRVVVPDGDWLDEHRDKGWSCRVGWCDGRLFPQVCGVDGCRGLLHAHEPLPGRRSYDYACDRCTRRFPH